MAIISEDYVSFETAKLLKEKGFDELCECAYSENGQYLLSCYKGIANRMIKNSESLDFSYSVVAPTIQIAMKWLRLIHDVDITIIPLRSVKKYFPRIESDKIGYDGSMYTIYKEAAEAGIKYCLENLIK